MIAAYTEFMSDRNPAAKRQNGKALIRAIFGESALRTEDFFRERAAQANLAKAKRILNRAGKGNPPAPGDELD